MSAPLLSHHHPHATGGLRKVPAPAKMGAAFGLILGTVMIPSDQAGWLAVVAGLVAVGVGMSGLPLRFLARRLVVLSPFVLGVALVNALAPAGRAHWLTVAAKSTLCLSLVLLVSNTTSFAEVLGVLKRVRVPALLVTTIALMHRYLFVLVEEAERMRRARASRTFTRGRHVQWRNLSTVVGQLFIRASERAERIYDAMTARGWK